MCVSNSNIERSLTSHTMTDTTCEATSQPGPVMRAVLSSFNSREPLPISLAGLGATPQYTSGYARRPPMMMMIEHGYMHSSAATSQTRMFDEQTNKQRLHELRKHAASGFTERPRVQIAKGESKQKPEKQAPGQRCACGRKPKNCKTGCPTRKAEKGQKS